LTALGVADIGADRLRQVGRGVRDREPSVDQLCGNCASGVLAISPDGTVWPCVFSRWLTVGNVRAHSMRDILRGSAVAGVRSMLGEHFASRSTSVEMEPEAGNPRCGPQCHPSCNPACQPNCAPRCSPSCAPCAPSRRCWPYYR
jgi:hypothetical protein